MVCDVYFNIKGKATVCGKDREECVEKALDNIKIEQIDFDSAEVTDVEEYEDY